MFGISVPDLIDLGFFSQAFKFFVLFSIVPSTMRTRSRRPFKVGPTLPYAPSTPGIMWQEPQALVFKSTLASGAAMAFPVIAVTATKKHKRYLNECGDRSPLDLRENAAKWF